MGNLPKVISQQQSWARPGHRPTQPLCTKNVRSSAMPTTKAKQKTWTFFFLEAVLGPGRKPSADAQESDSELTRFKTLLLSHQGKLICIQFTRKKAGKWEMHRKIFLKQVKMERVGQPAGTSSCSAWRGWRQTEEERTGCKFRLSHSWVPRTSGFRSLKQASCHPPQGPCRGDYMRCCV